MTPSSKVYCTTKGGIKEEKASFMAGGDSKIGMQFRPPSTRTSSYWYPYLFDLGPLVTIFRPRNVKSRIGGVPDLVLSGLSIVFMNHHKELRRNFLSVFWRPSYVHE
jgi:hypothetical protein